MNVTNPLELCKNYLLEADQLLKQSKQTFENLNYSLSKLQLLTRELSKQVVILKDTSQQFNDRYNSFIDEYTAISNQKRSLFTQIENKLEILKKKVLDKGLVFKNKNQQQQQQNEEGSSGGCGITQGTGTGSGGTLNTLFDFIDVESLDLIKNQFSIELTGLNEICEKSSAVCKHSNQLKVDIESRFLEIQSQFNKQIEQANLNSALLNQQHNLHVTISNQLINVTSQFDYITFYKPPPNSTPIIIDQFNKEINNKKEQIQLLLSSTLENIQVLSKNTKEFESKSKSISSIYSLSYLLYDKFLSNSSSNNNNGNEFENNWELFERYSAVFDQKLAGVNYFLGELYSLSKWYDLFDSSYDNLLEEVKRRQVEYFRQKTIAEQYDSELKQLFNNEIQNRLRFYDSFGKYLPVSLFSTISDPPVQFQIKQIEETDIDYSLPIIKRSIG